MPKTDLKIIQKKLRNLSALFELGEDAVPYIEETLRFIEGIVPLIDEISDSLLDTTQKMPGATSQLSDVTRATELATNEILDIVGKGLKNCNQTLAAANTSREAIHAIQKVRQELRGKIRSEITGPGSGETQKLLDELWQQTDALDQVLLADFEIQIHEVNDLKKRLNQIMMSLQVQDITSQQIASVTHVITTIRSKLFGLQERLGLETGAQEEKKLDSGSTFDANARYDQNKSIDKQNEADALINQFQLKDDTNSPASQNDIDRFFGS